jgi:hypothetical protein
MVQRCKRVNIHFGLSGPRAVTESDDRNEMKITNPS